jgi:hypothetical protein
MVTERPVQNFGSLTKKQKKILLKTMVNISYYLKKHTILKNI